LPESSAYSGDRVIKPPGSYAEFCSCTLQLAPFANILDDFHEVLSGCWQRLLMKVLVYNIMEGGGERMPGLLGAVADLEPDLAVLCELNGWEKGPAPAPLDSYFFSLHTTGKTPYRVGILSRDQPEQTIAIHEGLHHGALLVRLPSLTVVATHLHPFEEPMRVREARAILKGIHGIAGPVIIAGDLNSCREDEAGISGRSGALEVFSAGGFDDPAFGQPDNHSLRTGLSPMDPYWRFDYILSRGIIWDSMRTLHDPRYALLSDHWPVMGFVATGTAHG
jgi:hypothetical protein